MESGPAPHLWFSLLPWPTRMGRGVFGLRLPYGPRIVRRSCLVWVPKGTRSAARPPCADRFWLGVAAGYWVSRERWPRPRRQRRNGLHHLDCGRRFVFHSRQASACSSDKRAWVRTLSTFVVSGTSWAISSNHRPLAA